MRSDAAGKFGEGALNVCLSAMPAYLDASASDVGGILATTDYRGA